MDKAFIERPEDVRELGQVLKEPGAPFTGDPYAPQVQMPEYAWKMSTETQDVIVRLTKLRAFMLTKTFQELSPLKQELLMEQAEEMTAYAKTVCLRYCMALLEHG